MKGLERFETSRLVLRKPTLADAEAVFVRYASDPEVTRYLGWPRHQSVDDTRAFLTFSEAEWSRWPVGPYLIESRSEHKLLGGTGLGFESVFQGRYRVCVCARRMRERVRDGCVGWREPHGETATRRKR